MTPLKQRRIWDISQTLRRGVPVWADIWGHDVAHEWQWWRRQIRYQIMHRLDRW